MYVSASANVLSISGYHMVIVTGVVFFAIRAGLALVPALALRRPIKYLLQKWPVSKRVNSSRAPSDDASLIEPTPLAA
jgi:hypothetical protein